MSESASLQFRILFKNTSHGRHESWNHVEFHTCPRIGEYIRGIDPDGVFNLVKVTHLIHSPKEMFDGTLIVEAVPYEDEPASEDN